MLKFAHPRYSWCEAQNANIYMTAVAPNPADPRSSLLGLFPVSGRAEFRDAADYDKVVKRRKRAGRPLFEGWMGLALSCDGVHFSSILKLARYFL